MYATSTTMNLIGCLTVRVCQVLQHSLHDADAAHGALEWSAAMHHVAAVRNCECCHNLHVSAAAFPVAGWNCCTLHVVTCWLCGKSGLKSCSLMKFLLL